MYARVQTAPGTDMPRNAILCIVLAAMLTALVAIHWPRHGADFPVPPALDAAAIAGMNDGELITRVTTDLRFAAVAGGDLGHWRLMTEPARTVLAISFVERDLPPGCPSPSFEGFARLIGERSANVPNLDEVAAAYDVIGAGAVAAVVRDAARIVAQLPATDAPGVAPPRAAFVAVDQRFREQAARTGSLRLLRSYIRSHVADLAEAARR